MKQNLILVIDFGGQYNQLICRRVREANVYAEMLSYKTPLAEIAARRPQGIIFSGGPASVNQAGAPLIEPGIYDLGVPVLGICYGMQLMAAQLGGTVGGAGAREYGRAEVDISGAAGIWEGLGGRQTCWMSHGDAVLSLPAGFAVAASSDNTPIAAMYDQDRRLYAVQFHPEVQHTERGQAMLERFLFTVCGCAADWTMGSFVSTQVAAIRQTVGDKRVICALSGGVDSAVAAVLVQKAIGDKLTCIYVDNGFMRKGESDQVKDFFHENMHLNLICVNARERFWAKLRGVDDPESKRELIGNEFIYVFEDEAKKLGQIDYLAQGTIYPDVVESGTDTAETIKKHHNVGGLPERMKLPLIEPLRMLYKDEVRAVGAELGLPEEIIWRQPFPGPGLAIRVIGKLTEAKVEIVREADAILREEVSRAGLHREIWQYFVALPDIRSVGVMGDERSYSYPVILRAVTSRDAMTADWARLPYELLEKLSNRIVNEVPGVNRVVYDITSKPPGTIEWE